MADKYLFWPPWSSSESLVIVVDYVDKEVVAQDNVDCTDNDIAFPEGRYYILVVRYHDNRNTNNHDQKA